MAMLMFTLFIRFSRYFVEDEGLHHQASSSTQVQVSDMRELSVRAFTYRCGSAERSESAACLPMVFSYLPTYLTANVLSVCSLIPNASLNLPLASRAVGPPIQSAC